MGDRTDRSRLAATPAAQKVERIRFLVGTRHDDDGGFAVPAGTVAPVVRRIRAAHGPLAAYPLVVVAIPDGREVTVAEDQVEVIDG